MKIYEKAAATEFVARARAKPQQVASRETVDVLLLQDLSQAEVLQALGYGATSNLGIVCTRVGLKAWPGKVEKVGEDAAREVEKFENAAAREVAKVEKAAAREVEKVEKEGLMRRFGRTTQGLVMTNRGCKDRFTD